MDRKTINAYVARLLGEETVSKLRKFVKAIEDASPDLIVLIARKAICLFELIDYLDINKPNIEIVSDRVLDLDSAYFVGKKVIIVDDTLILGTTLKSIKEKLISYAAECSVFVFFADNINWNPNIFLPDYIANHGTPEELLQFCLTEVHAFDVISTPYLTDFPVSTFMTIDGESLKRFRASDNLVEIRLSTDYECENEKFTYLLSDSLRNAFVSSTRIFASYIETVKIRAYVSKYGGNDYRIKFVPIVLLKPIESSQLNLLFDSIVRSAVLDSSNQVLISLMKHPELHLRLIQYMLSYKLGFFFKERFLVPQGLTMEFRDTEMVNLFGKQLLPLIRDILENYDYGTTASELPTTANINFSRKDFQEIFADVVVDRDNILQSFWRVFTNLVDKRELPAREEIKSGNFESQLKNRLRDGIPFAQIVESFCNQLNIEPTNRIIELFGIYLDICNDLGISVPVICNKGNYYYRGYRHGELAKRTEGNNYLFYQFLITFCEANGYDYSKNGFDRLLVEKLAVLFYRIGARSKFLDVTYTKLDPAAIHISFYLMGSVLSMPDSKSKKADHFFTGDKDWFLLNHCYGLFHADSNNKYFINRVPERGALCLQEDAEYKAKQIGRAFGNAIRTRNSQIVISDGGRPLNASNLVILASCYSATDICMALAAELRIISSWLQRHKQIEYLSLGDNSFDADFSSNIVYSAFNQAFFKFKNSCFEQKNAKNLIDNCSERLKQIAPGTGIYDTWVQYAGKLSLGQEDAFDIASVKNKKSIALIKLLCELIFCAGYSLIYIRDIIEIFYNITAPKIWINSTFRFSYAGKSQLHERTLVKKPKKSTTKREIGHRTEPGKKFCGKTIGETVIVELSNEKYECVVHSIDNTMIVFGGETELEKFFNNVQRELGRSEIYSDVAARIQSRYQHIRNKMATIHNCQDISFLQAELRSVVAEMYRERENFEHYIQEAVKCFDNAKENAMSLLL